MTAEPCSWLVPAGCCSDDFDAARVAERLRALAESSTRLMVMDVANHFRVSIILAEEFLKVSDSHPKDRASACFSHASRWVLVLCRRPRIVGTCVATRALRASSITPIASPASSRSCSHQPSRHADDAQINNACMLVAIFVAAPGGSRIIWDSSRTSEVAIRQDGPWQARPPHLLLGIEEETCHDPPC